MDHEIQVINYVDHQEQQLLVDNCARNNNNNDDDDYSYEISDCESCVTDSSEDGRDEIEGLYFGDDLIRLDEKHIFYNVIEQKFLSNMGSLAENMKIVAIHKKNWSNFLHGQARLQCFMMLSQTSPKGNHGGVKVKYGWFGGSKQQISTIMSHGFGLHSGDGVCLSSINSLIQSVQNCVVDDEGLRHIVLCRAVLGDKELDESDSSQSQQSSGNQYDDVTSNNYIVSSNKMSTHILPEYVISFKAPSNLEGILKKGQSMKKPSSPWMSFPNLILMLSKSLPKRNITLINKYYKHYRQDRKISRRELIEKVRRLAGDDLLMQVIKSHEMKRLHKNINVVEQSWMSSNAN